MLAPGRRGTPIFVSIRKPGTVDEIHQRRFDNRKQAVAFIKSIVSTWPKYYHFNYQKLASANEWENYSRANPDKPNPRTFIWLGTDNDDRGPNDGFAEGNIQPLDSSSHSSSASTPSGRSARITAATLAQLTLNDVSNTSDQLTYEVYSQYQNLLESQESWLEDTTKENDPKLRPSPDVVKVQLAFIEEKLIEAKWLHYHHVNVIARLREHLIAALMSDNITSSIKKTMERWPNLHKQLDYAIHQIKGSIYDQNYWLLPDHIAKDFEEILFELEGSHFVRKVPIAFRRYDSRFGERYVIKPTNMLYQVYDYDQPTVDLTKIINE